MSLSVSARLVLVAGAATVLLLPLAGWAIGKAFERSAMTALEARIDAYASTLAGLLEVTPERSVALSRKPQELRFEQVYSGWYWQLHTEKDVLITSRSLWDTRLPPTTPSEPRHSLDLRGPRDEPLHALVLKLQLAGLAEPVHLLVSAPLAEVDAEVAAFRRVLVTSLGSLGLLLVIIFALQIRWGLAPMRRMEHELQSVRAGHQARVDPDLPRDLRAVAEVMNEVLGHQEDLIQRARSTAGNLAHALKTPLATMRLHLESPTPNCAVLRHGLRQVQDIVDHHLTRASAAGRAGVQHRHTDLRRAIQPVIDAVIGMSRGSGIRIELVFDGEADVAVDPYDLQELVGNLLDNAAQWARSRVTLRVNAQDGQVELRVDDDGPGIPSEARDRAVDRGTRLDERSQGSGLGLAIVRDIASLYGIAFSLTESDIGGLSARLTLPRERTES